MECDYFYGWIKKSGHICKNLTKNGKTQWYSWEHRIRKRNPWSAEVGWIALECKGLGSRDAQVFSNQAPLSNKLTAGDDSRRMVVSPGEVNSHGYKCSMMNSTATMFATRGGPQHTTWISAASHPNEVRVQLTLQSCMAWDLKWAHTQPALLTCPAPSIRCGKASWSYWEQGLLDRCSAGTRASCATKLWESSWATAWGMLSSYENKSHKEEQCPHSLCHLHQWDHHQPFSTHLQSYPYWWFSNVELNASESTAAATVRIQGALNTTSKWA